MESLHYDQGKIRKWEEMPNGAIRVWGTVAHVGWLEYLNKDGSTRQEYVSEEILFDEEHLDSIGGTVLTLDHPNVPVKPSNYKKYTVGAVGTNIIQDIPKKCVDIVTVVVDEEAIKSVIDGKTTDLSMGYKATTVQIEGNKYKQTKRICNHVALVEHGRAKNAALHLDGWHVLDDAKIDEDQKDLAPPSKPMISVVSVVV